MTLIVSDAAARMPEMADPSERADNFEKTVSAVTALVNAVPVYQDLAQPAAREIGKSLVTVGKTLNIILAPLAAVVWGYERIQAFVETRVAEKLRDVPTSRIVAPSPNVAGPVLEALRFAGHEEALRELYANLLASSLDSSTARNAHPAFVEIIKNMTPDEARILRCFSERTEAPLLNARLWNQDNTGYTVELRSVSNIGVQANCQHPDLVPS
jgi:Abortive infection alpha